MNSVLGHASQDMVRSAPYPHISLEKALPELLYAELSEQYPPMHGTFVAGDGYRSNRAKFYRGHKILTDRSVSKQWLEFIEYHTSALFYDDIVRVFGDWMHAAYPRHVWTHLTCGLRGRDTHSNARLLMEAQFGINTPVRGPASSVRGLHVDNPNKLYNGLLYMRHPDDEAAGGELTIYMKHNGRWREHSRVPYESNRLVFFINVPHAVHAVSPREAGPYPRRYVAFSGELKDALFEEAHAYGLGNG